MTNPYTHTHYIVGTSKETPEDVSRYIVDEESYQGADNKEECLQYIDDAEGDKLFKVVVTVEEIDTSLEKVKFDSIHD